MTRAELVAKLAGRLDITKTLADALVLEFLDAITANLQRGNRVVIHGFGSFILRGYRSRVGRKPVSGEPFFTPARKKPLFRASKELLALVNSNNRRVFTGKTMPMPAWVETASYGGKDREEISQQV